MTVPQFRGSLYIDGQWCEADSGATLDVTNPATEEVFCQVASCGRADSRAPRPHPPRPPPDHARCCRSRRRRRIR